MKVSFRNQDTVGEGDEMGADSGMVLFNFYHIRYEKS